MDIFNDFLISMKNIKTFFKETLNKDKHLKSNSFINNIDEIILYLKLNEGKIKYREDISNSLFLKTINTNIKVLDIYNYLPKYIKEFILKSKDNNNFIYFFQV